MARLTHEAGRAYSRRQHSAVRINYQDNASDAPSLAPGGALPWSYDSIRAMQGGLRHGQISSYLQAAPIIDLSLVTYHSAADLPAFLNSLLVQAYPLAQICLLITQHAADAEEDGILDAFVRENGAKFRQISVQRAPNGGYGAGHNRNSSAASSDYLLVSNVDLQLCDDTISILVFGIATSAPDVGAIEARQSPMAHPKYYDPATLRTSWISGCCLIARRAAFLQVRGFDTTFFMYGEDVDFSLRLQAAGFAVLTCPWAVVRHAPDPRTKLSLVVEQAPFSEAVLTMKYGSRVALRRAAARFARRRYASEIHGPSAAGLLKRLAPNFHHIMRERRRLPRMNDAFFNGGEFEWRRPFDLEIDRLLEVADRPRLDSSKVGRVSIIVFCDRDGEFDERTLHSALFQTYDDIEVVMASPGGVPPSATHGDLRTAGFRLTAADVPKGPPRAALLGALAYCTGDFIGMVHSGDILFLDHVEILLSELEETTSIVASWSVTTLPPHAISRPQVLRITERDTGIAVVRTSAIARHDALKRGGEVLNAFLHDPDAEEIIVPRQVLSEISIATTCLAERRRRARPGNGQATPSSGAGTICIPLVYHRISNSAMDPQRLFVSPRRFYHHVNVAQKCVDSSGGALRVAFHFDDAYDEIFLAALAANDLSGIETTVFVPTGFVTKDLDFIWDRLRETLQRPPFDKGLIDELSDAAGCHYEGPGQFMAMLSERARADIAAEKRIRAILDARKLSAAREDQAMTHEHLRWLASSSVELGLHGHTHRSFAHFKTPDFEPEIEFPFAYIAGIAGRRPTSFAFPFGSEADLNGDAIAKMKARGVQRFYSMLPHPLTLGGAPVLPRWQVGDLCAAEFETKLKRLSEELIEGPHRANSCSLLSTR